MMDSCMARAAKAEFLRLYPDEGHASAEIYARFVVGIQQAEMALSSWLIRDLSGTAYHMRCAITLWQTAGKSLAETADIARQITEERATPDLELEAAE